MTLTGSSLARHVALLDRGVGLDGQSCSCLIVGWPFGLSSPTLGVGHSSVMFLFYCWPVGRPTYDSSGVLQRWIIGVQVKVASGDGRAYGDSEQGFSTRVRMDHRDMSQRYGNLFSTSRGHSQSPLPASSCSNEQPRRRKNQEAEIPPGSIVDLFTQILRQVSRNAQPEESLNMEYLNILKTIKCLETYKFKGGINTNVVAGDIYQNDMIDIEDVIINIEEVAKYEYGTAE
ncbi:hypothetical protein F2Q69_00007324 [Brassica cretica]|uniref:Uncharacterized protein n=1 Tax=Brassica cretica TaxID=69181 RepID=A0A8S9NUA7_BRACR|nr:hypothetical protein F2Q69_00007324 [Brassica cretica]